MTVDPKHVRLKDATLQGRIADLRNAVIPILAGNYLSHFTDHSVLHSDHLCHLVDLLTETLGERQQLTPQEAFIVYSACYLHDVGMQHQRAGTSIVVRTALETYPKRRWDDLNIETRKSIVREQHHRISAEMVRKSIDAPQPTPLGIQLTHDWHPGQIAALCEAHCLDVDSDEYKDLTADAGSIRLSFLSAILRISDILDESRRRSQLYLERTRDLDLESRMHWWRHYYVAEVKIDPTQHEVVLFFEFPTDRWDQYRDLIVPLQVPSVQKEFERHSSVLAQNGCLWHIRSDFVPVRQSTARPMEASLERYVIESHAKRQNEQAEKDRLICYSQLEAARPTIERSIGELRGRENLLSADELLDEWTELAKHLWNLGGRRSARALLDSEYERLKESATPPTRLNAAVELAEMTLQDGGDDSDSCVSILREINPQVSAQLDSDPLKFRFYYLLGNACANRCIYTESLAAFTLAIGVAPNDDARALIQAEAGEFRFLQGELDESCGIQNSETPE